MIDLLYSVQMKNSVSETRSDHFLEVDEFWIDNDTGEMHYSLSVVHPDGCIREKTYDTFLVFIDYRCWIGCEIQAAGMDNVVYPYFEYPYDDGFDWLVMASVLINKPIPFKYSYVGWYDSWGEWDQEVEIELI